MFFVQITLNTVSSSSNRLFFYGVFDLESSKSNLTLVLRVFLSFVILSARLTRGRWVHTSLALSISFSESIRTQHYYNSFFTLSKTQVKLSEKYIMYKNEHRRSKNLTTQQL